MEELTTLVQEFEACQVEFQEKAKRLLETGFKTIFEKVPDLEAIRWNQYTPYFNDGDSCEFGVCEPEFKLKNAEGDSDDFDSLWGLTHSLRSADGKYDDKAEHPLSTILESVTALICCPAMEEPLKNIFGDHKEVTVTRTGTEIEDYEHE